MPVTAEIASRIHKSFARQSLMATINAQITVIDKGRIVLEAPVGQAFLQQQGFAHGGLVFSLGDTAAGYAALTALPPDVEVMTVEMKINLLAPGAGKLRAEGRVLKAGRRIVVVAADVWSVDAGQERLVAAMQGTMIPVEG